MKERHAFMRLSLLTFPASIGTFSHLRSELEFVFCLAVLTAFFHVHRKINSCHAPHWADELPARGGQGFLRGPKISLLSHRVSQGVGTEGGFLDTNIAGSHAPFRTVKY